MEFAGKCRVQPVVFEHDHHVDIYMDSEGRFLRAATTVPPLIPSARLRMPTMAEEIETRKEEWRQAFVRQLAEMFP